MGVIVLTRRNRLHRRVRKKKLHEIIVLKNNSSFRLVQKKFSNASVQGL